MGKRRKNVTIVLFLTKVNVFATDFLVFHRVLISRFPQLINCTNCCMDSFIAKYSLLFKATLVMAQSIPRVPIPPGHLSFSFRKAANTPGHPTVGPGVCTKTPGWGLKIGCKFPTPGQHRLSK